MIPVSFKVQGKLTIDTFLYRLSSLFPINFSVWFNSEVSVTTMKVFMKMGFIKEEVYACTDINFLQLHKSRDRVFIGLMMVDCTG